MRIGIDASWAAALGTGTGSYTHGLVRALAAHQEHELVLYFRPGDEVDNPLCRLDGVNVRRRFVDGWYQPGRSLVALARAASHDNLDLFHSPGYFLPLWRGPKVVTFHDVNMFVQWDKWWRPGMRASWAALCAQTLLSSRLARRILADSQEAARRIRRVLGLPQSRLSVLYPGVDDRFFDTDVAQTVRGTPERYGLSEYLLYVGVLSPQKNLDGIVRAVALAAPRHLQLAIVGREDGSYFRRRLMPLLRRLDLEQRVRVLGVVPPFALPGLYAGASAFLFPSFAEGFGLPPLEAMACGTPVIASNCSSLPEVLDQAALFVDPGDIASIASAIQRMVSDGALRGALIEKGRRRAAEFRWSTTARQALDIYGSVA